MATYTGNDGAISVNGYRAAAVKSYTIDLKADTIETTTMGVDARTFVKGLSSFSGSADILFDTTDWNSSAEMTTWNPTDASSLVGAAGVTAKFWIYTDNGAGNDLYFQGDVIVTGYSIKASMDGMVEATISLQGTGGATYTVGNSNPPASS